MPNYELTYILRPLEEANLTATNERITTIVKNAGGDIIGRNDWGRRRLAYPIRKVNDGYYTTLYLTLPGASVRGLERSLQLIDDVQRYLVVKVEELKVPATPAPVAVNAPIPGTTQPAAAQSAAESTAVHTEAAPPAQAETPASEPAPGAETTPTATTEPTTEGS